MEAAGTAVESTVAGVADPFAGVRVTGAKPGHVKTARLLLDMRWVLDHDEEDDNRKAQKVLRLMLKEDKNKFISQMAALEKDHQQKVEAARERQRKERESKGQVQSDQAVTVDVGAQKAEELVERLLSEFRAGTAFEAGAAGDAARK